MPRRPRLRRSARVRPTRASRGPRGHSPVRRTGSATHARKERSHRAGCTCIASARSAAEVDIDLNLSGPRYADAIAEFGADSAVFRTWGSIPADYRTTDPETGRRLVMASSRTGGGTVLVPHLGPKVVDEWYSDQTVFGPDRPAAAAKAITEYVSAKAAAEDRPWDRDNKTRLAHAKRLRDAYSEYGDTFRGH